MVAELPSHVLTDSPKLEQLTVAVNFTSLKSERAPNQAKLKNFLDGLVVGFWPKERPNRICDSVR